MKPSPVSEFPQRAAELPLSPACPGGFSFRPVFITGPSLQDEGSLYFGSGLFPTAPHASSQPIRRRDTALKTLTLSVSPGHPSPSGSSFPGEFPDRRKMSHPILRMWTFSALRMSRPVTTVTGLSFDSEATNLL